MYFNIYFRLDARRRRMRRWRWPRPSFAQKSTRSRPGTGNRSRIFAQAGEQYETAVEGSI